MVPIPSGASAIPVNNPVRAGGRGRARLRGLLLLPVLPAILFPAPPNALPSAFNSPKIVRVASASASSPALDILTWNIDRGTNYRQILMTLQRLHPDVVMLQEVDTATARTGYRDVALDLAHSLELSETYGIEFEELSQEEHGPPAYTGQATLSRLPIRSARILRFESQSGFWQPRSWIPASIPILQRRLGSRMALVTEFEFAGRLLVTYNLHLESRSYGRLQSQQLDEVLADCAMHYPPPTAVLIGGDLNSKYLPSHYLHKMQQSGFHSALGEQIERTHTIAMALDWIFARGLADWQSGRVDRSVKGSDHYPVAASLKPSH